MSVTYLFSKWIIFTFVEINTNFHLSHYNKLVNIIDWTSKKQLLKIHPIPMVYMWLRLICLIAFDMFEILMLLFGKLMEPHWRKWSTGGRTCGFVAPPYFLFTVLCNVTMQPLAPTVMPSLPSVISAMPWCIMSFWNCKWKYTLPPLSHTCQVFIIVMRKLLRQLYIGKASVHL